jgi:hypothetical protein
LCEVNEEEHHRRHHEIVSPAEHKTCKEHIMASNWDADIEAGVDDKLDIENQEDSDESSSL